MTASFATHINLVSKHGGIKLKAKQTKKIGLAKFGFRKSNLDSIQIVRMLARRSVGRRKIGLRIEVSISGVVGVFHVGVVLVEEIV